jgi:enoyl-CoA hydratase/carnithine racemase
VPLVAFRRNDQLGEIVIDSPPQNLFSGNLLTDLRAATDEAADSDIRALLLRAQGSDFSAGAEVSIFIGLDEARAVELESTVLSLIGAIEDLLVPTLALIHGQCYAGALELCLACDLIWAAEGSQIGQIEAVAGGIPYAGGIQRLASRIGAGRAEMVFSAAVLRPETLASWGVIKRVVPADRLAGEGRAFAESLASGPTRAHTTTKRVLHAWRSGGVAAADRVTRAEGPAVLLTQDLQDGIASLQRDAWATPPSTTADQVAG